MWLRKSPESEPHSKLCFNQAMFQLQDLCRQLYPDSIRALYGKTTVQNAVHCTDLPEDGVMEVEYFFKLMVYDTNK